MGQKIDRTALAQRIREIEGLSNEERSALLELVNTQKRYGLVWEEKVEDVEERLREKMPVLKEVEERRILSEDKDAPNHMIIEGDNLEALTALTYTHEGKIDLIYIDPPYNTGNDDFIYNDSYVDKEDAYRHSKWLSFMNKRLKIAKRLLSDKGVIFISIDDNEQAQLELLCNEIFNNARIANLIWQKKTGALDAKGISTITEYVLVYSKNSDCIENIFTKDQESFDIKRYRYKDEFYKERGPYYLDTLDRGGLRYSDSLNYGITLPNGKILFPNSRSEFVNDGWTWKWGKEKLLWGIKNKFIEFTSNSKNGLGYSVKYKVYLNVNNEGKKINRSAPHKNLITGILNADAANYMKEIFNGNNVFKYSKPLPLIYTLLSYINNSNALILDFFAGSGTTLHATMQLNKEDGGNRQCILVTNNENNICEEVTYERNKRVIEGYITPKVEHVEGLKGNNLRYYKTELLPRGHSMENMRRLMNASTDLLCIKEGVYCEQEYLGELRLKAHLARYFDDGERRMLIIYREETIDRLVEEIKGIDVGEHKIKVYAFSPSRMGYEEDFEEVRDKVIVSAMPAPIYDAEEKVMPKKNPEWLNDVEEEEVGL